MVENEFIERIINMIKDGRLDEARPMTKDYIRFYPEDVNGWKVLARIGETKEEKVTALENVLALNPEDDWAKKTWAYMLDEERLRQAAYYAREGKLVEAREIVDSIITEEVVSVKAWLLKARLTKDKGEAVHALEQVLKLEPNNKNAQERLFRLTGKKFSPPKEKNKKDNKRRLLYFGIPAALLIVVLCLVVAIPLLGGGGILGRGDTGLEEVAEAAGLTCEELIERALQISDSNCQKMGSFEVCYGNYDIYADLLPGSSKLFETTGDIVPMTSLDKLVASPLDLENQLWGVALLKVPANLPGTLPGQNVTFIIFGDTTLDPVSSDMSAFYFASGITGIKCDEVEFDGLYLEMPDGAGIAFTANGVEFVLEGDSTLTAKPGEEITLTMLEGSGTVTAGGETVTIGPGVSVSVPLGDDLQPSGGPLPPVPLSEEEVILNCIMAGIECPSEPQMTLDAMVAYTEVALAGGGETGEPTYTPVPGTPGMPTNTSVPLPTSTSLVFIPTDTVPSGFPTSTPKPPTNTSPPGAPTNTPVPPAATDTPVPPAITDTPPPPPATCGDIVVVAGSVPGTFNITNNAAGSGVYITQITLTWPAANGTWKKITLEGNAIGNPNSPDNTPPTQTYSFEGGGVLQRTIEPGTTELLEFGFDVKPPIVGTYHVIVSFNVPGCSKSASQ